MNIMCVVCQKIIKTKKIQITLYTLESIKNQCLPKKPLSVSKMSPFLVVLEHVESVVVVGLGFS